MWAPAATARVLLHDLGDSEQRRTHICVQAN